MGMDQKYYNINREMIESFKNTNVFLQHYHSAIVTNDVKIGSTLRIRLPNDFRVIDRDVLPLKETVVLATAAIAVSNPVVSRRFWSWSKK